MQLIHKDKTGADPEIEEGGGHTYKMGIGAARVGTQLSVRARLVPRPSRIRRLQYCHEVTCPPKYGVPQGQVTSK